MERLIVALALASLCVACTRHTRGDWQVRQGSCENVCARYLHCKGTQDPALRAECSSDCRFIYHEDGRADTDSLSELQSLDCDKLLSFIEGEDGRALGEAAPGQPGDGPVSESQSADANERRPN